MCYKKRDASRKAMEEVKAGNQKGRIEEGQGKQAMTDEGGETAQIGEFAGNEGLIPDQSSPTLTLMSRLVLMDCRHRGSHT